MKIEKGEFVGVIGPSGSGKLTFLHLVGLLDRQTAETITINGTDISEMSAADRSRFRLEKMGYVFQDYALIENFTVAENIAIPALGLRQD
ncbi:MAG: ATP-binding cassette domain-containing protein [Methanobacteriota archaeon]